MFRKLLRHARGNAVAYLALFVALGGTAVAATSLKANSVGTKQLKNGAVTGQKVAKNTLTGTNIQAGTLGTVPNAANAANAAKLGGQAPSAYSTIIKVTPGTDLTGGGSSGTVTLNADETKLQHRVTGTCSVGSAVIGINQDGSVGCESTLTQMMAGSAGPVAGGTSYLAASGLSTPTGTEANTGVGSSALPSTAGNLWVKIATPTSLAGLNFITWTVTLDVNGAATALTCTAGPGLPLCADTGNSVSIPPDASLDFNVSSGGTGTSTATVVTIGWTDQTLA